MPEAGNDETQRVSAAMHALLDQLAEATAERLLKEDRGAHHAADRTHEPERDEPANDNRIPGTKGGQTSRNTDRDGN